MKMFLSVFVLALFVASNSQSAEPASKSAARIPPVLSTKQLERVKREAVADVEQMRVMTQQMIDQVFSLASWVIRSLKPPST